MDIYFLGTSSGAPSKERNVSAIALIESQGKGWYLIDCGEGSQHQILHSSVSLSSLRAIFITHLHGDHCYGLPGLLASASLNGRTSPLTIFGPAGLEQWLQLTFATTDLHLQYELVFMPLSSLHNSEVGPLRVTAFELSHRIACCGFAFSENSTQVTLNTEKLRHFEIPQGPLWGKLRSGSDVELGGKTYNSADFVTKEQMHRKIIICGDNDNPELLHKVSAGCDVLVHEATYTRDMADQAKVVRHTCAGDIAMFAQASSIPNLVLTHFSARYQKTGHESIETLRDEAQSVYSGKLFLANDFDRLQLDKSGGLTLLNH